MAGQEPPGALCCSITLALMRDPVSNSLGNTYERAALVAFWAQHPGNERDPLTGSPVPNTALVPNQAVRGLIVDWLDERPAFVPEGWGNRLLAPLLFPADPAADAPPPAAVAMEEDESESDEEAEEAEEESESDSEEESDEEDGDDESDDMAGRGGDQAEKAEDSVDREDKVR